eukprot:Lankesteria_metandrocarpae@DN3733_c0_g1_i3.p1
MLLLSAQCVWSVLPLLLLLLEAESKVGGPKYCCEPLQGDTEYLLWFVSDSSFLNRKRTLSLPKLGSLSGYSKSHGNKTLCDIGEVRLKKGVKDGKRKLKTRHVEINLSSIDKKSPITVTLQSGALSNEITKKRTIINSKYEITICRRNLYFVNHAKREAFKQSDRKRIQTTPSKTTNLRFEFKKKWVAVLSAPAYTITTTKSGLFYRHRNVMVNQIYHFEEVFNAITTGLEFTSETYEEFINAKYGKKAFNSTIPSMTPFLPGQTSFPKGETSLPKGETPEVDQGASQLLSLWTNDFGGNKSA